ncbi:hypothetical protein F183_A47440 [Bryobacterales bacterium F-183]|nr:hypothetical protein F183_A47440 [Bryobacterales bacterium F-183]
MRDPNLVLLGEAAGKLRPLLDEIVFVGGATLGLLITDPASAPIRATIDIDVIAEITSYAAYVTMSERLRALGFAEDPELTCRWRHEALVVDVMPSEGAVLGFTNIWYKDALRDAIRFALPGGESIRLIRAPYFLGTKMEAFRGRGRRDYLTSHDLEDFVAVIEGRESIAAEVRESPLHLRQYLAHSAAMLLQEDAFLDVLPGFVVDQGRTPFVLDRLRAIASVPVNE